MEARLVSLPTPQPGPSVRVDGERILVDRLALHDPALAAWVGEQPEVDRPSLAERALKIGLTAIQGVGVSVDVDVVRREFDALLGQANATNEKAAQALEQVLRTNFADGDGRLPRTLEAFLGDRGKLKAMVDDLFDPTRRDSAIGRIGGMLETYFDGDASKLARLLDPTRLGSPLHQFREEVASGFKAIEVQIAALQAAQSARAEERARSAAKGGDFEDLLEALLGEIARGSGDTLDRTSDEAGDTMRSKKGDFVITIDPDVARGSDLRIVVEAKDRAVSGRQMRDELHEAKTNRSAAIALVVFTPQHAPTGIAPFDVRSGDVYAVLDPDAPDLADLLAAVRLARLLAIHSAREVEAEIDAASLGQALARIREQLDLVKGMKAQLTSIGTAAGAVAGTLDKLRDGVIAQVTAAERELAAAGRDRT